MRARANHLGYDMAYGYCKPDIAAVNAASKATAISKKFDTLAGEYESNRLAPWYIAHSDEILGICRKLNVKNVLDVGCGTGYLLRELCKIKPGIKARGIDLSSQMIAIAGEKASAENINNLRFINDDWVALDESNIIDLEASGFDLVICANTFHYFSDPKQSARKFCHLLNGGGILILLERDKSNSPLTFLWGLLHRYLIKDHVEFYTQSKLVNVLEEAGFNSVSISRNIRRYFWKGKLFTNISLFICRKS